MKFGVDYFPDVHPDRVSGQQYFADVLDLAEEADRLGYDSVKIVEHYFTSYGGYSPDPCVFLAACSQRTRRLRMVTGAVLPVFNHPLKLAGQVTMLDAISGGRLDVGFARAFMPYEFDAFGISMDESRARFEEGIEAITRLWTEEAVTFEGKFPRLKNVTSLPRPTHQPHPPIWVAAGGGKVKAVPGAGANAQRHPLRPRTRGAAANHRRPPRRRPPAHLHPRAFRRLLPALPDHLRNEEKPKGAREQGSVRPPRHA